MKYQLSNIAYEKIPIAIPSSGDFPQIQWDLSVLLSRVCLNSQDLGLLEFAEPRVLQSFVTVSDNYRDKGKQLTIDFCAHANQSGSRKESKNKTLASSTFI